MIISDAKTPKDFQSDIAVELRRRAAKALREAQAPKILLRERNRRLGLAKQLDSIADFVEGIRFEEEVEVVDGLLEDRRESGELK